MTAKLVAPFLVAAVMFFLGYVQYAPGTAFRLSPEHYRAWAFPAFRYSDIIWLYLRDNLSLHPIPYRDYALEYPPLTGLVSWLLGFAPDLPTYFTLAYLLLAGSTLVTIWSLCHTPGTNPWYFAAAPAVFFYTGHQWDPLAVAVTAVSVMLVVRGRPLAGALGLSIGISLKLFPLAFAAALLADLLRRRRWRELGASAGIILVSTLLFNLPAALANSANWSFFFRWNRDRLADSGIWVLWRGLPVDALTSASLLAAVIGGVLIAGWAWWCGGPIFVPLGATALIWWLLVNKTFTTHLMLWILFALALLRPPVWLWLAVILVDIAGFQLGNYLNLYNIADYHSAPLIRKAVENIYDPLQLARSIVLGLCLIHGLRVLWRGRNRVCLAPAPSPGVTPFPAIPRVRLRTWSRVQFPRPAVGTLGPLAFLVVASIVMTWPLAKDPAGSTVAGFDPLLQIWISRWIQHIIVTNPLQFYDANIFYPFAQTLAYTDANLPGALLAWPIDLIGRDPILTNTIMVLLSFVVAGCGMYALVLRIAGNRAAAFLAAVAYAVVPFRMIHLWHLNWLQGSWLPWVVLTLLLALEKPTWQRGCLLGFLIAIQTLTSFYFAFQLLLVLGVLILAAFLSQREIRSRARLRMLILAGAVSAIIVLPFALPYFAVNQEQGLVRTIDEAERYKAEPASYLTLPPWDTPNLIQQVFGIRSGENDSLKTVGQAVHPDGHRHPEIVIEDALYPGAFAVLGTALAIAFWRRRWLTFAFAAVAVIAAVLSLGPALGPMKEGGFPLPYGWLFDHLPLLRATRVPARLGGLVAFALVLLAGLGFSGFWTEIDWRMRDRLQSKKVAAGLTAIALLLILIDQAALPVPIDTVDSSVSARAPYEWLATQPDGVVMEFPAESIFADPAATSVRRHVGLEMLWSTLHWKPLVNGNSGFIPRAHSDFIEAFVGNIPNADGALALHVSHLDRDNLALLQQIGVRYLFFHRVQYREEVWPAVLQALDRSEPAVVSRGQFGQTFVYEIQPMLAPPPRAEITLFAPTLIGPDSIWSPFVAIDKPGDQPSVLALTRPSTMSLTWYDQAGRYLEQESFPMKLPPVVHARQMLCSLSGCNGALGSSFPEELPAPTSRIWQPAKPGHYVVQVAIAGDAPLNCRIDLDVLASASEVREAAPSQPERWAKCIPDGTVPVNNPGAVPFVLSDPSVTFAGQTLALAMNVTTREAESLRGWFLLAPPNDPAPWTDQVFQSPIEQRLTRPDDPTVFSWLARPGVPSGVYGLSFWFHHETDAGWEHAAGAGFEPAPIIVDPDGSLRWAGPVRWTSVPTRVNLKTGRSSELVTGVTGTRSGQRCEADWRLVEPRTRTQVARGHGGSCDRPRVTIPDLVSPGHYRLEVDARLIEDGSSVLSDGFTLPVTLNDVGGPGEPR